MSRDSDAGIQPLVPRCRRGRTVAILTSGFWILTSGFSASPARGAPTQEDVFRSIQQNVGESGSISGLLPFVLAGVALVIVVAVVGQWRGKASAAGPRSRTVNSQGKLVKEVLKSVPVRPAEVRQLKLLAEDAGGGEAVSPLTLLLCPSLLTKSVQARQRRGGRMDRRVVAQLVRRAGIAREPDPGVPDDPHAEPARPAPVRRPGDAKRKR